MNNENKKENEKFNYVKNNTLKMIRNNERFEALIETLIVYAEEIKDYTLAMMIKQTLDSIEDYDEIERNKNGSK